MLLTLVAGKLVRRVVHKQRWRRKGTNATCHSRPPDDCASVWFCSLVVVMSLWGWLRSGEGVHTYEPVLDGFVERPSRRTVQRWMARALPLAEATAQAVRLPHRRAKYRWHTSRTLIATSRNVRLHPPAAPTPCLHRGRSLSTLRAATLPPMWPRSTIALSSLLIAAAALSCDSGPAPFPALSDVVRPEHPRPDRWRDSFVSLNRLWDFVEDPDEVGEEQGYFRSGARADDLFDRQVQVPFAWEAPLSGLVPSRDGRYSILDTPRASTYRGVAWYRLRVPAGTTTEVGADWWLVFGAVDFRASVYIDGEHVMDHEGGYTPFAVNLAPHVRAGDAFEIVVRAEDRTELADRSQPVGKQGGPWYTRTSGIWQTVYLEARPSLHVKSFQLDPDLAGGRLRVQVEGSHDGPAMLSLVARLGDREVGRVSESVADAAAADVSLELSEIMPWDAEHPTLYDLDITLQHASETPDVVHTYFGMRELRTDWLPGRSPAETSDVHEQAKALFVNGEPRYLRCVLDQSYYPDGVYTAPSEERIRADLQAVKDLGFNCIRLHIKVDEPLKYRIADELGLYVIYDLPSLDVLSDNVPGFVGRDHVEQLLRRAIARDRNHPSVVAWVVFNENWGLMEQGSLTAPQTLESQPEMQTWVREMVDLARSLDPSRPVEDNSAGGVVGVYEHLDTDLNSFHHYTNDIPAFRAMLEAEAASTFAGSAANHVGGTTQGSEPWLNSEFASFSVLGVGETDPYCDLFGLLNELRRRPRLVGYVLTQLTDVEYETNGLMTYAREPKDLCTRAGVSLGDLLGDDAVVFDALPGVEMTSGVETNIDLGVSLWSSAEGLRLRLSWDEDAPAVETPVMATRYDLTALNVPVTPPSAGTHWLVAELVTAEGSRVAANRIEVVVR